MCEFYQRNKCRSDGISISLIDNYCNAVLTHWLFLMSRFACWIDFIFVVKLYRTCSALVIKSNERRGAKGIKLLSLLWKNWFMPRWWTLQKNSQTRSFCTNCLFPSFIPRSWSFYFTSWFLHHLICWCYIPHFSGKEL